MKAVASHRAARERGAALLAALCFAAVFALIIGSYISVCYRTLLMSNRSVQGSRSVQLAETGMEEALWALNKNDWSTWTLSGATATKTLTGFAFGQGVTGTVTLAVTDYDGSAGTRVLTSTGIVQLADGTLVSRTLTSSSNRAALFVNAIAATTGRVKFKSGGTVDSYDSTLGDYTAQTPTYSAIISSGNTTITPAPVQLTNAQVKGYVATAGAGPSYGTSARLVGPSTPGSTKIDVSRISTSPYQPLFDESIPTGVTSMLPSGSATIGTVGATAPELYSAPDVIIGSGQNLTIDGPVVLIVSGDFVTTGTGKIIITANGSLEVHLAGDLALDGGGIVNNTKLPRKLLILAKADNTYDSLGIGTTTPFHGVIYTPRNALTIGSSLTIYGAIVAKSVTFNGASPVIHYDFALRGAVFPGIETPFGVSNWRETTFGD